MPRTDPPGNSASEGHRVGDYRENRRKPEAIGNQPDRERADELQEHRYRNIADARGRPDIEPRQHNSRDDATAASEDEHRSDAPARQRAGGGRRNGKTVDEQGARVVV